MVLQLDVVIYGESLCLCLDSAESIQVFRQSSTTLIPAGQLLASVCLWVCVSTLGQKIGIGPLLLAIVLRFVSFFAGFPSGMLFLFLHAL